MVGVRITTKENGQTHGIPWDIKSTGPREPIGRLSNSPCCQPNEFTRMFVPADITSFQYLIRGHPAWSLTKVLNHVFT